MERARRTPIAWIWLLPIIGMAWVFLWLEAQAFSWRPSDEVIYLYMIKSIERGLLPYRDYFFAHPPLHWLVGVLAFGASGGQWMAPKVLSIASAILTAGMLVQATDKLLNRFFRVALFGLYLSCHTVLFSAAAFTGVQETVFWIAASIVLHLRGRDLLSGIASACAVCTGLYAWPAVAVLALAQCTWPRGRRSAFGFGFLVVWGLVHLAATGTGGWAFWEAVYGYHLQKISVPKMPAWLLAEVQEVQILCGALAALVFPCAVWCRRLIHGSVMRGPRREVRPALLAAAISVAYCVFFLLHRGFYHFYFLLVVPWLCILTATWAQHGGAALLGRTGRRMRRFAVASILVFLAANTLQKKHVHAVLDNFATMPFPLLRTQVHVEQPRDPWLKKWMYRLFWRYRSDSRDWHFGVSEFLPFSELRPVEVVAFISVAKSSGIKTPVWFGDSTIAPALALITGGRMALDEADTNFQRFASGTTRVRDWVMRFESQKPDFVLVSPGQDMNLVRDWMNWLRREYSPILTVRIGGLPTTMLGTNEAWSPHVPGAFFFVGPLAPEP